MAEQKPPQPPDSEPAPDTERIPAAPKLPNLRVPVPPKDELAKFYGDFAKMRTSSSSKLRAMRDDINAKLDEVRAKEPSNHDLSSYKLPSESAPPISLADEPEPEETKQIGSFKHGSYVEVIGPERSPLLHKRGHIEAITKLGVEIKLDNGKTILLGSLEYLKLLNEVR